MPRTIPLLAFAALLPPLASAQAPAPAASPAPTFLAADVHPAPIRAYPDFFAVLMPDDRLVFRDASLVDLISTAYDVTPESVQAGPAWVERDRFDIFAKVPPHTTAATRKLMLRTLLAERFHLTTHSAMAPLPAYVLTAPKSKLKSSETTADQSCQNQFPGEDGNSSPYVTISCRNMSLDSLADLLHNMAGDYLDKPVINSTGLDGQFDFTLKWTFRRQLTKAGSDGINLFDAIDKQLGLRLTLDTSPRPAILIDAALRTPTPNPPGLDRILPSPPVPKFEVATIKPTKPGTHGTGDISGGKVNFTDVPLRLLIDLAWDLNESDRARDNIVNAPKWLDDDHYDILAKVADESSGTAVKGDTPMDIYEVELMLRALLVERFQIKAHMEDRPVDSWILTAPNPRLKAADPSVRTVCKEGPGPDGKDPRLTNAALSRLITCRNMSMPEIADELQRIAPGYIFYPVVDNTGLKRSYDFTLSFSSVDLLNRNPAGADADSATPNGAVSLADALSRQLGLKLEKTKRPLPVLVIEHIEEKPTEN